MQQEYIWQVSAKEINFPQNRSLASHPCLPQASSAMTLVSPQPQLRAFPLVSNPDYIPPPCSCLKGRDHPPNPNPSNNGNTIGLLLIEGDSMPTYKTLKDSPAQASLQPHSIEDTDHRHPGKQQFRGTCGTYSSYGRGTHEQFLFYSATSGLLSS